MQRRGGLKGQNVTKVSANHSSGKPRKGISSMSPRMEFELFPKPEA